MQAGCTVCAFRHKPMVLNVSGWWASGNARPGPTLRVSDSIRLKWGPRICISSKFQGDADAAGS